MKLVDFQQKTVDRISKLFHSGQSRVLLADEVGLGKTIVAHGVIDKVSEWHRTELHDDHFKVVYVCSNLSIASQNVQKLGIEEQLNVSESRLSMQHLKIYQRSGTDHAYKQLIPLTPATSFSMTIGGGCQEERALMYAHLRRLPEFEGYCEGDHLAETKLSRFLAFGASANWADKVCNYESIVLRCDNNGSNYIAEMAAAIREKLASQPDLINKIKAYCDSEGSGSTWERRCLINKLRIIFAEISLSKLDPDLVIMDEFQRFRDLIAPADYSESGLLKKRFIDESNTKVLLLSATPYKPYSTLEEIAEDDTADHYHEFNQVMDFLFYTKKKHSNFQTVWKDYSTSLCEISNNDLTILIAKKEKAENALYKGVCRTERFNTGIIDDRGVENVNISAGDILSYDAMQSLLDAIVKEDPSALRWRQTPIDYIKSAPYLLSFMEHYKLYKQIKAYFLNHPDQTIHQCSSESYLLLKKATIHSYRPVPANNARLEKLENIFFSDDNQGAEMLLWVPSSHPYYHTGSIFDRNRDFSKILVFSSWEMVPRMISVMMSYESERRTIGKLYSTAESHRGRGYFLRNNGEEEKDERRYGISRLKKDTEEIVCIVSETLAGLYRPEDSVGIRLSVLKKRVQSDIEKLLNELRTTRNLPVINRSNAAELIECIKAIDGNPDAHPSGIPRCAASVITNMAIGSPAVCAYRTLLRYSSDSKDQVKSYAREIAKEVFVSLFNKAESSAVLDLLYGTRKSDDTYYQNVFRYCVDGNLQAVVDEYAHILDLEGKNLKQAIVDSAVNTVSIPVDVQEAFPKRNLKMRTHFAVGYYNARTNDDTIARVDRIRKAFNSPFRPFVLATTSIGQEGLDFHCYCRKVMHWNLPSNPIDLEQREGRINRYKCLAVRQNLAHKYPNEKTWDSIFKRAAQELKSNHSDLVPYWCLPNLGDGRKKKEKPVMIERIVPMYPYSQDQLRYKRIIQILSLYRLTLGQPRQEELISILDRELSGKEKEEYTELFMNLCPYDHSKRKKNAK